MATSKAKIEVKKEMVTFKVGKKKVFFNILKLASCPTQEWCDQIDQVDKRVAFKRKKNYSKHWLVFVRVKTTSMLILDSVQMTKV